MGGGGERGERKGRRVTGDTKAASQIAHSPHDAACMDDAVANVSGQPVHFFLIDFFQRQDAHFVKKAQTTFCQI